MGRTLIALPLIAIALLSGADEALAQRAALTPQARRVVAQYIAANNWCRQQVFRKYGTRSITQPGLYSLDRLVALMATDMCIKSRSRRF